MISNADDEGRARNHRVEIAPIARPVSSDTSGASGAGGMPSGAQVTLDAWRERVADRLDLVRFRFIEALDRRAARWRIKMRLAPGAAASESIDRSDDMCRPYNLQLERN
jgi:hypothetical protein